MSDLSWNSFHHLNPLKNVIIQVTQKQTIEQNDKILEILIGKKGRLLLFSFWILLLLNYSKAAN